MKMGNVSRKIVSRLNAARKARPGFTLIELLVVIAIIALLVSIILPALTEAKKSAKTAQNNANLKQYGNTLQSYATDYKDIGPAFSWKGGRTYSSVQPNGSIATYTAGDDVAAAKNQASDIIKRRAVPDYPNFPDQGAWIPHILYTHLIMMDYLAARLPEPITRSPFDPFRARWAEDPTNPTAVGLTNAATDARWPFSSSYQITSASFAPDRFTSDGGSLQQAGNAYRLYQYAAGSQNRFRLGGRKLSDCKYPDRKVFAYTDMMRHRGKVPQFYTANGAETILVAYDASVRTIRVDDMNEGGYWAANSSSPWLPALVDYSPTEDDRRYGYDGPDINGDRPGRCRWTYGSLTGIDYGAKDALRR